MGVDYPDSDGINSYTTESDILNKLLNQAKW